MPFALEGGAQPTTAERGELSATLKAAGASGTTII